LVQPPILLGWGAGTRLVHTKTIQTLTHTPALK
jgi:hypothetical protein